VVKLFKTKNLLTIVLLGTGCLGAQTSAPFNALNATTYQPLLASGVVAVLVGENLTPPDQIGCVFSDHFGWASNLEGVQVLVNQRAAPIASHCRLPQAGGPAMELLTCQFPWDLNVGEAQVVVRVNGQASAPVDVALLSHAPALAEFLTQGAEKLGAFRHTHSGRLVTAAAPAMPGDILSVTANGLGPTDPAVGAGEITPPAPNATVATPIVSVDGIVAQVLSSALRLGHVGVYDVIFRVPSNVAEAGEHRVLLNIGGVASNEVILPGANPAAPSISSAVNAASFAANAPAAPGSILSLFVSNLEGETNLGLFPATAFDGLSVTFNGVAAPLFAVVPDSGQINVLAPLELPETGEVEVRVTSQKGASAAFLLPMASASPGIFRVNDPSDLSHQHAAALLGNTAWLAIPNAVAESLSLPINCAGNGIHPASYCGNPLRPGEFVQLYLTGLGKVTLDGNPSAAPLTTAQSLDRGGSLYNSVIVPQVTIGGLPAQVAFSGLSPGFAGLYQVNAIVPAGVSPGDSVPLRVSTPNGLSDTVMIAIQAP
jgi:uncharacterized protein (TIGR03437 family)